MGLCAACRHVRRTGNRRGSVFYLCGRASHDTRFARYPAIPVLRCIGFEPMDAAPEGGPNEES